MVVISAEQMPKDAVNKVHKQYVKKGARHKARVRAVELAFEAEAKGVSYEDLISQRGHAVDIDDSIPPVTGYAHTLLLLAQKNHVEIDNIISRNLIDWTVGRLPAVDRAILRLALAEMFFDHQVPLVIIVDEAVGIAKELSTDNSPAFINGLLANLVPEADKIRKG